jgi:predicted MFS family arabinose efflux permease
MSAHDPGSVSWTLVRRLIVVAVREPEGRAARSTAILLFVLMVIDFADRQVVVTTFPYLRAEFAVSDAQLGALVSAVSVTVALGALPLAVAVDRWSRVRAIALMGTVWSGATAACAVAPGFAALLAARVGVGVGQAGFGPAGAALLAAAHPPDRRATVLGAFQAGGPLGIVVGAVAGSLVAAQWGWRAAFLVLAVPGLVLALLFLRVRDYPRARTERSPGRVAARALLRARSAQGAMLGGALLLVVVSTLYTWLPTHLERSYGMPPARAGVLTALVVVAGAAGTAGAAHLADRLARRDARRRMLVPVATAAATTATLGTAFAVVPPGVAQMVLLFAGGAMAAAAVGPVAAVVVDVVPANVRATATSMYVLVQNLLGLAVGPVLTGALADRWGMTTAFTAVAGLGLGAAGALWWGSRFYARDRSATVLTPPSTDPVDGRQAAAVRPTRRRTARSE